MSSITLSITIITKKSRGYSQAVKNCLGYIAFTKELQGKLLQRQARELLALITDDELSLLSFSAELSDKRLYTKATGRSRYEQ